MSFWWAGPESSGRGPPPWGIKRIWALDTLTPGSDSCVKISFLGLERGLRKSMKVNRRSHSQSFRGELYEKMRVFYGTSRWPKNVKEKTLRFICPSEANDSAKSTSRKTAVTRCLKIFMMCAPAPSQKLALKKRPDQHLWDWAFVALHPESQYQETVPPTPDGFFLPDLR